MQTNKDLSLWQNRDYIILWLGQTVSSFGSKVSAIVFPLLVLDLTNSPAQAGFIGAVSTIPYILFSLFVGAIIDRVDRKKIMIYCDIGRSLALGSIFIALMLNHLTLVQLYIVAFVEGTFFVFFDLAEISSLLRVVGKKQLVRATAQNSATDGIASLTGPSIGTAIYQAIGRSVPFLIDSLSYVISVISLLFIKIDFQKIHEEKVINLKKELFEGFSWLWKNKIIRFMTIQSALGTFAFANLILILIVLAKEQQALPLQIGAIVSIGSVGGIIGSIIGSKVQEKFNTGKILITIAWINAFLWILYIVMPNFIFLGINTAFIFIFDSIWVITLISYRLKLIPDELQGRVNASIRFLNYAVAPLALATSGLLLEKFGAKPTILLLFFVVFGVAILTNFNKEYKRIENN